MTDYTKNENNWTEFKAINNYNKYDLLKKIGTGCAIGALVATGVIYELNKNKDNKEIIGHEINLKELMDNQIKPNQIEIYNTPIDFTNLNSKQNYLESSESIYDLNQNLLNVLENSEETSYLHYLKNTDRISEAEFLIKLNNLKEKKQHG
jgi:hypothetical protein